MPQSQQPSPPEPLHAPDLEGIGALANPVDAYPLAPPEDHPGFALAVAWRDRHAPSSTVLRKPDGDGPGAADDDDGLLRGLLDDIGESFWHDPHDPGADDGAPLSRAQDRVAQAQPAPQCHVTPIDMTLILMMAKALDTLQRKQSASPDGIAIPPRPGAAGRISLIRPWSRGAMVPLVALLEQPELATSLLAPAEGTRRKAARPVILMALAGSGGAGRKADRKADLVRNIEAALLSGRGVVLLGAAPADLPEDLEPFLDIDLRLPPPDRALIAALLRLLCPDRPDPVPQAALPGDAALARLTHLQLSVVCRGTIAQRDPLRIIDNLHRLTTPRATGQGDAAGGLSAVEGQEEAVASLRRLAADIASWRAGALDWKNLPRGILLEGPPGVGKTLLAQALAAEAGLPLISLSFAECQKAGHLGDTLAALDARVAEAEARAPAVVFLDELDGFSSRMGADHGRHSSYMSAVITGLLQQIDRLLAVEGVVLIAATNAPEAIDPAIRRQGRFDATLRLAAPTRAGHAAILTRHLGLTVEIRDADPALAGAIADMSRRLAVDPAPRRRHWPAPPARRPARAASPFPRHSPAPPLLPCLK